MCIYDKDHDKIMSTVYETMLFPTDIELGTIQIHVNRPSPELSKCVYRAIFPTVHRSRRKKNSTGNSIIYNKIQRGNRVKYLKQILSPMQSTRWFLSYSSAWSYGHNLYHTDRRYSPFHTDRRYSLYNTDRQYSSKEELYRLYSSSLNNPRFLRL